MMVEVVRGGFTRGMPEAAGNFDSKERASIYVVGSIGLDGSEQASRRCWCLAIILLPRVQVPDLGMTRYRVMSAFAHAGKVINRILGDFAGRRYVAMPPFLLMGPPGSEKATLAKFLFEELGLPMTVYGCGGVSGASLLGTSLGFSTATRCLPPELIGRSGTASAALVLDDIEKAGVGRLNGTLSAWPVMMLGEAVRWEKPRERQLSFIHCQRRMAQAAGSGACSRRIPVLPVRRPRKPRGPPQALPSCGPMGQGRPGRRGYALPGMPRSYDGRAESSALRRGWQPTVERRGAGHAGSRGRKTC